MTVGPLLGLLAAVALLVWIGRSLVRPRYRAAPGDVDREELEAAEREVRDLETSTRPEDDTPGGDWGPGTARPPTRL